MRLGKTLFFAFCTCFTSTAMTLYNSINKLKLVSKYAFECMAHTWQKGCYVYNSATALIKKEQCEFCTYIALFIF